MFIKLTYGERTNAQIAISVALIWGIFFSWLIWAEVTGIRWVRPTFTSPAAAVQSVCYILVVLMWVGWIHKLVQHFYDAHKPVMGLWKWHAVDAFTSLSPVLVFAVAVVSVLWHEHEYHSWWLAELSVITSIILEAVSKDIVILFRHGKELRKHI